MDRFHEEILKKLGSKYKFYDGSIYRDFENGYDVELTFLITIKGIKRINLTLWYKKDSRFTLTTRICSKLERVDEICDELKKLTETYIRDKKDNSEDMHIVESELEKEDRLKDDRNLKILNLLLGLSRKRDHDACLKELKDLNVNPDDFYRKGDNFYYKVNDDPIVDLIE